MGKESWSGRLVQHCQLSAGPLSVMVDGPYGMPGLDPCGFPFVLLVCGGVGSTPCVSIMEYLFNNFKSDVRLTNLQKVVFVWAVPDEATLSWYQPLFKAIENDPDARSKFVLKLHVSNSKAGKKPAGDGLSKPLLDGTESKDVRMAVGATDAFVPKYATGRPSLDKVLQELTRDIDAYSPTSTEGEGEFEGPFGNCPRSCMEALPCSHVFHARTAACAAFFCGPAPMGETLELEVAVANMKAKAHYFELHKETFEF